LIVHGYAPLYPAHSATPGSREDGFAINILANGVWHAAKFAAELTFAHVVDGQFQAWRAGKASQMPEVARREPIFDVWGPAIGQ
jgi:hypothetical protein